MAFTVNDVRDMIRILRSHPEWLEEVRQVILTKELLELPDLVRKIAESQDRLAESQDRTDRQIARLIAAQERMDSDIKELKYDVSVLKEDMRGVKEDVSVLKEDMHGVKNELSSLRGSALETRYTRNAHGYFSRWLRKIRVVLPLNSYSSFEDLLEEKLSHEEIRDVLLLDLIVRGRAPQLPEHSEVYLAVEVSAVIDRTDVDRARKRAGLMRKADLFTLPVVAGEKFTEGALSVMESTPVLVLQNGKNWGWDETLATFE